MPSYNTNSDLPNGSEFSQILVSTKGKLVEFL